MNQSYKTVLFLPITQISSVSSDMISAKYTNCYKVADFPLPFTQTERMVDIIILPIIQILVMVMTLKR